MSSKIRGILLWISVMLLLIMISTVGCTPAPKADVRIGYLLGDLHQLSFAVASEKGFFEDAGINVKTVGPFDSGPSEMNALDANQLDMGWVGVAPAVTAAAKGVNLSIVAGVNSEGSALVVDKTINNVSDLRGEKIATPAPGSVQYILLGMLLSKNNLSYRDLQILPGTIKPPDMAGALETGNINGYLVWEPYVSAGVVRSGGKILAESKDIWPGHPCCVVVVRKDFAQQHPEAVAKVLQAHQQATDFIHKNPSEAKSIAVKFTNLDAKIVEMAWPRVIYDVTPNIEGTKTFVKEIIALGQSGVVQPIITTDQVPDIEAFVNKTYDLSYLSYGEK